MEVAFPDICKLATFKGQESRTLESPESRTKEEGFPTNVDEAEIVKFPPESSSLLFGSIYLQVNKLIIYIFLKNY